MCRWGIQIASVGKIGNRAAVNFICKEMNYAVGKIREADLRKQLCANMIVHLNE